MVPISAECIVISKGVKYVSVFMPSKASDGVRAFVFRLAITEDGYSLITIVLRKFISAHRLMA